jgi:hypothetical protein
VMRRSRSARTHYDPFNTRPGSSAAAWGEPATVRRMVPDRFRRVATVVLRANIGSGGTCIFRVLCVQKVGFFLDLIRFINKNLQQAMESGSFTSPQEGVSP